MGKVKIIERDNLEKNLNEQKLQFSGLVNESQAEISVILPALNMSIMEQSRKSKTVTQSTHSL